MKLNLIALYMVVAIFLMPGISAATLFEENFDDTNFTSRGWYDSTNVVLTSSGLMPGSTRAAEFRFLEGARTPTSGWSMRKRFAETETVYVRYYVKYSSNWQGSRKRYHPHEFYLLTNKDGSWTGPAFTNLTAYIEQNALRPHLAIQDGRNIDLENLNRNLVGITENRSVAGCNGDSDGYGNGSCYHVSGGVYHNDKSWMADTPLITTGTWHKVEAYFKLNSIRNGKGIADGVMKYWLNDELILDYSDVILRTAKHPDMKFNQFIIGPWIGDGSPVDQTFWVDNLLVAISGPGRTEIEELGKPTNLRIIPADQ